jgi:hypothetical protein
MVNQLKRSSRPQGQVGRVDRMTTPAPETWNLQSGCGSMWTCTTSARGARDGSPGSLHVPRIRPATCRRILAAEAARKLVLIRRSQGPNRWTIPLQLGWIGRHKIVPDSSGKSTGGECTLEEGRASVLTSLLPIEQTLDDMIVHVASSHLPRPCGAFGP